MAKRLTDAELDMLVDTSEGFWAGVKDVGDLPADHQFSKAYVDAWYKGRSDPMRRLFGPDKDPDAYKVSSLYSLRN